MKTYHQLCGVAKALDVVGQRWALLIVRDLLLGPRRWSDLLEGLPGLTTNLLATRLQELASAGLIEQRTLPRPSASTVYALTSRGRTLEPVVLALGAFGAQYLGAPDPDDRRDARWAMLSLKRRYLGSTRAWIIGLRVDDRWFRVEIGDAQADVTDGQPEAADLELHGDFAAFAALLFRGASARDLVARGRLQRHGSVRALDDFARAFGLRI